MPSKVGGAATGALGGAATGAAIGSAVPGIGTAIGAVGGGIIGGIGGWLSTDDDSDVDVTMPYYGSTSAHLANVVDAAQGRAAPTIGAAQLNGAQIAQSRGGLMDTAGRLGVTANRLGVIAGGQQAGAGELAVNRQLGQGLAAQTSAARMARGANSALAYRNAARNSADMSLAGAGYAAQAQMQDQAQAMRDQTQAHAQLGQIYGSMYGMDTTVADRNAQLAQQAALSNQGAQMTQQQMNDAREMQAMGQLLGWDQAAVNARLAKAGQAQSPSFASGAMQGAGQILTAYANQPSQPAPTTTPNLGGGPVTSPGGGDPFGQYRRSSF